MVDNEEHPNQRHKLISLSKARIFSTNKRNEYEIYEIKFVRVSRERDNSKRDIDRGNISVVRATWHDVKHRVCWRVSRACARVYINGQLCRR